MLTARVGLDGHAVYGRVRNASEQVEKIGLSMPSVVAFATQHGWIPPSGELMHNIRLFVDLLRGHNTTTWHKHGMAWHGITKQHGMAWHDMAWPR